MPIEEEEEEEEEDEEEEEEEDEEEEEEEEEEVGFITKKFVTMHGHMNVKFHVYSYF